MQRLIFFFSLIALPLAVSGEDKKQMNSVKIFEVQQIDIKETKTFPAQLMIEAVGEVNSGGWKNPQLVPSDPPSKNGIYHFDFVAERPTRIVTRNMVKVTASLQLSPKPDNFKGLVIHSQTNSKEFMPKK